MWRECTVLQLSLVSKGTQFLYVITPGPLPAVYTLVDIPNHSKSLGSSHPILKVSEEVKCAVHLCYDLLFTESSAEDKEGMFSNVVYF